MEYNKSDDDFHVHGDMVSGGKITTSNIHGSGSISIGRGATVSFAQGSARDDVTRLFAEIYRQIEATRQDPQVDSAELSELVQNIQREVSAGEDARPERVERWLVRIKQLSPSIFGMTARVLLDPVTGIPTAFKRIVEVQMGETSKDTGFQDLLTQPEFIELPDDSKKQVQSVLDGLQTEIDKGEKADLSLVREQLTTVSEIAPALRTPMLNVLLARPQRYTPIMILVRKVLG